MGTEAWQQNPTTISLLRSKIHHSELIHQTGIRPNQCWHYLHSHEHSSSLRRSYHRFI